MRDPAIFKSLMPYYGNKRKLCPAMFNFLSKFLSRDEWQNMTFVDAFLGSGAVSLYAKAQGFKVICNDIAERSYIAGKALIENNETKIPPEDMDRLFMPNSKHKNFILINFTPDVFGSSHASFLDNAFANANSYLAKYLLIKYIFQIRPFSKFSSPNAFNRPFAEGRFDEIKRTYMRHLQDNLKPPLYILQKEKYEVNEGVFTNGHKNEVHKTDVYDFVHRMEGDVLYLDPPYSSTLACEDEYRVLDVILGEEDRERSRFSDDYNPDIIDEILKKATHVPYWLISYGNAGGKNRLEDLKKVIS